MKACFAMLAFAAVAAAFSVWLLLNVSVPKVPPIQIPQAVQRQPDEIPNPTSVTMEHPVAPVTWGDIQNQIRRKADAVPAPNTPDAPVPPEPDPYAGIDALNAKAQKELQERFTALKAAQLSPTNAPTKEAQRP